MWIFSLACCGQQSKSWLTLGQGDMFLYSGYGNKFETWKCNSKIYHIYKYSTCTCKPHKPGPFPWRSHQRWSHRHLCLAAGLCLSAQWSEKSDSPVSPNEAFSGDPPQPSQPWSIFFPVRQKEHILDMACWHHWQTFSNCIYFTVTLVVFYVIVHMYASQICRKFLNSNLFNI